MLLALLAVLWPLLTVLLLVPRPWPPRPVCLEICLLICFLLLLRTGLAFLGSETAGCLLAANGMESALSESERRLSLGLPAGGCLESYRVNHGCSSAEVAFGRSPGSLFKSSLIRFLASALTPTHH